MWLLGRQWGSLRVSGRRLGVLEVQELDNPTASEAVAEPAAVVGLVVPRAPGHVCGADLGVTS